MADRALPSTLSLLSGGSGKERKYSPLPKKEDAGSVANYVHNLFQQSRTLRRWEEGNWVIDAKYLSGDQWVVWDPRSLALNIRAKKPWRVRQTINHMRPAVEIITNVLTSRKPKMQVVPGSTDPSDRQAARACDKLLDYLWHEQQMDDLLDEAIMWMLVTGRGFIRVGWDTDAGPELELPDYEGVTMEMLMGGMTAPMQGINMGEIVTDVISPFTMHVDPSATSISKARWAGDEAYMHVEEAKLRWPDFADKMNPDGGQDVYYNYARRLLYESDSKQTSEDIQDVITIKTLYVREGRGVRKMVVAGNVIVEDTQSPFGRKFPYVDFLCFRNPGSYWGQGLVNLARNAQTSFNRARSTFMEMMKKTGNPQWLVAKGAGVKQQDLTDEPGGVVYYNPIGMAPVTQLPGVQPPPGWQQLMSIDLQDMRDQMGILDVLRGDNPPGVRSGRSLAYLVEQNLGRHGPMIKRFERSMKELGRLWLHLAKSFYAEARMMALSGDDSGIEVFKLKQSDLSSPIDVIVNVGSALPERKVQRQDFVLSLWQQGLLVDGNGMPDHKKALKLLEFATDRDVYESSDSDRSWALEENERLAMGEQVMPQLHDTHTTHSDVHVAFMRTARFRKLPEQIQMLFRQHLDMHIESMMNDPAMAGPGMEQGPAPGGASPPGEEQPEPRPDMRGGPV